MKHLLLTLLAATLGASISWAQPDFDLDDCGCPLVDTAPVCVELLPGFIIGLPSACHAECLGLEVIEGGDCADFWYDEDWDDDDYGDWGDEDDDDDDDYGDWDDDDYGDWDDDDYGDYGDWNDSTWTGDWDDDDYGDWNDSTWTGDWDDDDYGDWNDSTWTGDWDDDDYGDWNDSTWTGDWTDSMDFDLGYDFDLLDSLLNDWLANGGQDLVDSLLNEIANGDTLDFPPFWGDWNLDSLLGSGDFSWLDSLLTGGGFPGGGLDSLLGDFDWNEIDSILNPGGNLDSLISGGAPWGLDVDLDGMWEVKGPGEEVVNFGTGANRSGSAGTPWRMEESLVWRCFPVPANSELQVQAEGTLLRGELWSVSGRLIEEHNLGEATNFILHVGDLPNGTYFLRLQDEHQQWSQKSVVVQH